MINKILRRQLTNIISDAIMEGIDDYCKRKNYIQSLEDKQILSNCIISSLGLKIESIFDTLRDGFR